MQWRDFPLEEPPRLSGCGIGRHGGLPLEKYHLPDLWCLHLYRDPMDLRVGKEQYDVIAGTATLIPPNAPIEFHFEAPTRHTHISARFVARGPSVPFPAYQQVGADFDELFHAFEQMVGWALTNPRRAESRLWELLWRLAEPVSGEETGRRGDPLVTRAMELIELGLGDPLTVAGLAHQLGVSHNHLTRRFRLASGSTVVDFIRTRRVTRARHLLEHSTIPIKAVASQVGLGDFHSLNKAMRRVTGQSPRWFRRDG